MSHYSTRQIPYQVTVLQETACRERCCRERSLKEIWIIQCQKIKRTKSHIFFINCSGGLHCMADYCSDEHRALPGWHARIQHCRPVAIDGVSSVQRIEMNRPLPNDAHSVYGPPGTQTDSITNIQSRRCEMTPSAISWMSCTPTTWTVHRRSLLRSAICQVFARGLAGLAADETTSCRRYGRTQSVFLKAKAHYDLTDMTYMW